MCSLVSLPFFFFFKQKSAYEMRISDWSSDVCSSDLPRARKEAPFDYAACAKEVVKQWGVEGLAPFRTTTAARDVGHRSEERRVGKESVSACRSGWAQCPSTKISRLPTDTSPRTYIKS